MRIGVDLDNTICKTSEMINKLLEEYAKEKNIESNNIIENIELKEEFFKKYTLKIFSEVEIKDNASEVLKRLKEKGNEIYIITARSNYFISTEIDVLEPTMNWLNKHGIVVDKVITDSYGIDKAKTCLDNNIDIMIDDDMVNYQSIINLGMKCILFDDKNRYNVDNRVSSWLDIEGELK